MSSFYSEQELKEIGFKSVGSPVFISKKCSIYGAGSIEIGDNTRIDDFCILSGKIVIGNNIHISAGAYLYGGETGIYVGDYSAISSRCVVYAESDDYTGVGMANPMVPEEYRNVQKGKVVFGKHNLIGSGCTVLPGVELGEGVSVGAMSLINRSLPEWTMNVGIPCRKLRDRERNILEYEKMIEKNR